LYAERLLPKAKAALESAQAGYVGGLSGFLDLLEAERTLLDFQLAHATARGQRVIVLSRISLVIMGRWPEGVDDFLSPASSDSPRPGPASRPQQRR
jgi:outer membrane protein TolC